VLRAPSLPDSALISRQSQAFRPSNLSWKGDSMNGGRAARRIAPVWLLYVFLTTSGAVRADDPAQEPLVDLNHTFRAAYARARQETLARTGPVIVVEGDNLVLLRQGKRTEVKFMPERYHTLKTVAHVPLALYALLAPF